MIYDKFLNKLLASGFSFNDWISLYPNKSVEDIKVICKDYKLSLFRTVSRGGILLASQCSSQNYNYSWPGYRLNSHLAIKDECLPTSHPNRKDFYYIFVMGGSTVHGCYLDDSSTIPAHLQSLYAKDKYKSKAIRVFNFSANNWTLDNMFSFFRTLILQGFLPDKVVTLYGVNDAVNMSWPSDISNLLDNLYKAHFERSISSNTPSFDFPYFEDSSLFFQNTGLFRDWVSSNTGHRQQLTKKFCIWLEANNKSFKRFAMTFGISYESWLQPIPNYLSKNIDSYVSCPLSLGFNCSAIVRIHDLYTVYSKLFRRRLRLANYFSNRLQFLDFCHYSEDSCRKIATFLYQPLFHDDKFLNFKLMFNRILHPSLYSALKTPPSSPKLGSSTTFVSDTNYPLY